MKFRKINRRRFLTAMVLVTPAIVIADARLLEPDWIKLRRLQLSSGQPAHRLVHFTDLHYKGDREQALSVVKTINALAPDFVCFTGDLIEETKFLPEALEILAGIQSPLYGVPGNHDYWSGASFSQITKSFAATGGAWLVDEQRIIAGGKINLFGASWGIDRLRTLPLKSETKNILLVHYPAWVKRLGTRKYDLILSGHSHGGQVRLPFYGPIHVPFGVDEYDLGFFHTPAGPLYVNPGIGWYPLPIRFNCRPEITVMEI